MKKPEDVTSAQVVAAARAIVEAARAVLDEQCLGVPGPIEHLEVQGFGEVCLVRDAVAAMVKFASLAPTISTTKHTQGEG